MSTLSLSLNMAYEIFPISFLMWAYSPDYGATFDFSFYSCLAFILKVFSCAMILPPPTVIYYMRYPRQWWPEKDAHLGPSNYFIPWKNRWEGFEPSAGLDR